MLQVTSPKEVYLVGLRRKASSMVAKIRLASILTLVHKALKTRVFQQAWGIQCRMESINLGLLIDIVITKGMGAYYFLLFFYMRFLSL